MDDFSDSVYVNPWFIYVYDIQPSSGYALGMIHVTAMAPFNACGFPGPEFPSCSPFNTIHPFALGR